MTIRRRSSASTEKARTDSGKSDAGKSAAVMGLGYVGLPLLVELARAGLRAYGFDLDEARVRTINAGKSPIEDVDSATLRKLVKSGRLSAHTESKVLAKADAISICVPTPLRKSKEPDISIIQDAVKSLRPHLRRGHLIILESTTYPGTTREIVRSALEETGLRAGKDFHLAFSPERVDPRNRQWPLTRIPKVIGGVTPQCTARAAEFYRRIFETVHEVSSADAAEMAKLLENTFRAVNIGLVNEFALACHRLGLDTWEIIDAAATKPFGFMPFRPGPGLGGHCIPVDPQYLSWRMRLLNFSTRFIEVADEINSTMPEHVVERLAVLLNERGLAISRAKILIVGVAYKPDVSDTRESPALDILSLLEERKARIAYHDTQVARIDIAGKPHRSLELTPARLKAFDVAVIVTAHSDLNVKQLCRHAKRVFDCRGVTRGLRGKGIHRL